MTNQEWTTIWDRVRQDPDYDLQDIFPDVSSRVDGRWVGDDTPNYSSIDGSLNNYEVLRFIREVPLHLFGDDLDPSKAYQASDDIQHTEQLAAAIDDSGEIAPLIVVLDAEGPYILEGGHRSSALWLLGAKAFPAAVVIDEDDL